MCQHITPPSFGGQTKSHTLRSSNIELCRIVAITMVLGLHTRFDGILSVYDGVIDTTHIFKFTLEALCIVGVNLFVLISGYFGIKLRWKSARNFAVQVYYFAILALIISIIIVPEFTLSKSDILKALFPLSHNVWFVPSYFILMLISPILNTFIDKASTKQLAKYTLCLYAITYIWANIWDAISGFGGYGWGFFIVLYLTGATLRKWSPALNCKIPFIGYLLLTSMIVCIAIAQNYLRIGQSLLWSYDCPFVYASSICLFLFFANCHLKYNRIINLVAASAFAVLLFHMSPVSHYFDVCEYVYNQYTGISVVLITICVVIAYFAMAFILDQPRKLIFKLGEAIIDRKNKKQ